MLPLGEGTLLDPFMGSGSTLAAATAVGYPSFGVEIDPVYYKAAVIAIPQLARLYPDYTGEDLIPSEGAADTVGAQRRAKTPSLFE